MESSGKSSVAEMVVLATSSALTAVFYSIYRSRAKAATRLKEAKKVSIDQDLKAILSETPGRCIPYAVIEGLVRSVKDTLNSQFVDDCKGVIERLTLKEEKMVWNRTTHLWNSTEKVIHQRTNTVPFALGSYDENISTTVRVMRPLDAAELDLETTYENFHPTNQSLFNFVSQFISGEQPKGIHELEEMLRLGDSVTGVGELVLDNDLIKLQPPKQGFCYFLTRQNYEFLLRKQVNAGKVWRILSYVFGLAACTTLLYMLWKWYVRCRESKKRRRVMEEFKEQQKRLMRELQIEESSVLPTSCVVCLSRERSLVFLECGHVCACGPCHKALPEPKKCPICRVTIDRVVPLYNS
ncbi:mitochondrial ubiquitin ligase activator of NFKB 1 [Gambusia affinis]|uniref:mitochondrial ubiquitin ligase activator of NFKB 1 n=1 Tax=Gambusia affinis TaxID=33528 RepID=UPI000F3723F4|nr:mitochondrial ubiquitin ligase activator of NFKB 1 [Gambusia affinis]XP_043975694.1 mitochondrial ubiquitin ligase activator of NFKB 1 [Gambusia affinis]